MLFEFISEAKPEFTINGFVPLAARATNQATCEMRDRETLLLPSRHTPRAKVAASARCTITD